MSWRSTSMGSSPRAIPSRLETRSTWVSTAMPSAIPYAWPSTTLLVLRPTPGSSTIAAIVRGTSPPCSATSARAQPRMLRVLARKNPVGRIIVSICAGRALAIASGVG